MSECPPPVVPGCPAVDAGQTLTPDAIEALLGDFRGWLLEAAGAHEPPRADVSEATIDLASVLNHFVALRHEVNLQTKAVRGQQEQNAEMLQELREAQETLAQAARARPQPQSQDPAETLRPLLKTLVDVHDALTLASRELPKLQEALVRSLAEVPAQNPRLRRWRGLAKAIPLRPAPQAGMATNAVITHVSALLGSFRAGYAMGLERIERAIKQHGLEAIPAQGCPFDPELMEVMDVVAGAGVPTGEVVAEIRRGYRWNGRVFRYAQVQVARD